MIQYMKIINAKYIYVFSGRIKFSPKEITDVCEAYNIEKKILNQSTIQFHHTDLEEINKNSNDTNTLRQLVESA